MKIRLENEDDYLEVENLVRDSFWNDSRFGFRSASKYNIYLEGTELCEENPFFMIRIFDESKLRKDLGIFHNPEVFNVDEKEVDEFDRQFEYKEKLVKEGQLGV